MATVQFVGLTEFRRELRHTADPKVWTKELAGVHRDVAKHVAGTARSFAAQGGGSARHFQAAVRGYGTVQGARVSIADPRAYATFWGAKQDHTGWNAGNKGRPNQPEWVGTGWEVGDRNQGPYFLNPAVADDLPWIEDTLAERVDGILRRAFPD